MYKAGKQWMVASIATLMILGLDAPSLNPLAVNVNASSHPRTHRVTKKAYALHKRIKSTTKTFAKNDKHKVVNVSHRIQYTKGNHKSNYDYESHSVCTQDQPLLQAYEAKHKGKTPYQNDVSTKNIIPTKQVLFETDNGTQVGSSIVTFPNDYEAGVLSEYPASASTPEGYVTDKNQKTYVVRSYLNNQGQPITGKVNLFETQPDSNTVNIANTGYNEYKVNIDDGNNSSPYVVDVVKVHKANSNNTPVNNNADANVKYTDNGTPEGSHTFHGKSNNSFPIGTEPAGLPDGYHVVNPEEKISYDNGSHNVPIAKNKNNQPKRGAKARVHYINKGRIKGRHNFTGRKHGQFRLGRHPEGLPRGYRIANPNREIKYDNKVARVHIVKSVKSYKPGKHFRWFKMSNHGAWAHTTLDSVGHNTNHTVYLKPNQGLYYRITRIYKIRKGNTRRTRYAFKFVDHAKHAKIYYVTGNPNYTVNSYWQRNELRHRQHTIKVIRGCAEYTSRYYDRYTKVRNFPVGTYLHVKRVIMIGRKGDCQTRFVLDNGHYVTANKNFTWLLK